MKEMTEVKIFNFCFALYFFVSFGLFLTGFFTGNKILTILGGILMTLEQFHDVFVSRVVRREYLFGALVGILIAVLLKKDWYLGAFWYFAIFYFIGILDNLRMLLFSTKRAKETTKNRELLPKGQYSKTDEKCPINPFEMTKRMKDVPEIIAWSRNKHLTIDKPEFWGTHHIFIDNSFKHAIFLLKADLTTHVLIGTATEATEYRKYDKNATLITTERIDNKAFEWKIYKDYVLYRGHGLPLKENPAEPYWGKVNKVETFDNNMNDQWIIAEIKKLYGNQD